MRGVALLALCWCQQALATCAPLPGDGTSDLPGGLSLACAHGSCSATVAGVHLADVRVASGPQVCDSTHLRVEEAIPKTCDAAMRRTGVSIRQEAPDGSGASEVVVDVLEPAKGLPWVGPQGPLKACLPHYAEKRGDVWQHTWRGEAKDLLFQVFEEDEAAVGKGNSRRGATAPASLVSTTARPFPAPGRPVAKAAPRLVPPRASPVRPKASAAPDADRF